ncbi:MAG: hypothetical protein ACREBE_26485, partial [bacterium]
AIEEDHLPDALRAAAAAPAAAEETLPAGEYDTANGGRERLEGLLARHQGNVNAVAREMRTSRTQIHRLCRRFGIDLRVHRFKRQ